MKGEMTMKKLVVATALLSLGLSVRAADEMVLRLLPGGAFGVAGAGLCLKPFAFGGENYSLRTRLSGADAPDAAKGSVPFRLTEWYGGAGVASGEVRAHQLDARHVRYELELRTLRAYPNQQTGLAAETAKDCFPNGFDTNRPSRVEFTLPDGGVLRADFDAPLGRMRQRHGATFVSRFGRFWGTCASNDVVKLGCVLSRPDGGALTLRYARGFVPSEEPNWCPLDCPRDIVAGSALDFSSMKLLDAPAGKYGWIVAKGPHFEFENRPGVPVRLYGVNLANSATFPATDEAADRLLTRLERLGYNTIRIHHHDRHDGPGWHGGGCTRLVDGKLELEPVHMERLDRLIARGGARGFYFTTDLMVSRRMTWRELGVDKDGSPKDARIYVWTWEPAFQNWCAFAKLFMGHRNKFNGKTYAEDPALATICLLNEPSFAGGNWTWGMADEHVRAAWNRWIAEQQAIDPNRFKAYFAAKPPANGAWWDGGDASLEARNAFMGDMMGRFHARAREFLRSIGVRAMLTGENFGPGQGYVAENRAKEYDYVDMHSYINHPDRPGGTKARNVFDNRNPIQNGTYVECAIGRWRVVSRPYAVSEFNFAGTGSYRGTAGAFIGALAALQDWSAVWRYAYAQDRARTYTDEDDPQGEKGRCLDVFDLSTDPLMQAGDRIAPLLFLRGDFTPLKTGVANDLDAEALSRTNGVVHSRTPVWADRVNVWSERTGFSIRGETPAGYRTVSASKGLAAFPKDYVSPAPTQFVPCAADGSFVVRSARTEGVFRESGTGRADALTATISGGQAFVWATSLDGKPLAQAGRILLAHLTDVQGRGMVYADETMSALLEWGDRSSDPTKENGYIVRDGTATVRLALEQPEAYQVRALATDGTSLDEVLTRVQGGQLVFDVAVRGPSGKGRLYYEVYRRLDCGDADRKSAWQVLPIYGGGCVSGVEFTSDPKVLYSYVDVGGPYRSDDGGLSWRPLHGNMDLGLRNHQMDQLKCLSVDPRDPNSFVAVGGSDYAVGGALVSRDGGRSFRKTLKSRFYGNGPRREGRVLARDPFAPDRLVAGGDGDGLMLSEDNGETWSRVSQTNCWFNDIRFDTAVRGVVYACCQADAKRGFIDGLLVSENGGRDWRLVSETAPYEMMQLSAGGPLIGIFDGHRKIRLSTDRGRTWTDWSEGLFISPRTEALRAWDAGNYRALAADGDEFVTGDACGNFYLRRLTDVAWRKVEVKGRGWGTSCEEWEHGVKSQLSMGSITVDPQRRGHWYTTDWYDIWETTDAGAHWTTRVNGMQQLVPFTVGCDPCDEKTICYGVADVGIFISKDGGKSYRAPRVSFGVNSFAFSRKTPGLAYLTGGKFQTCFLRSVDHCASWQAPALKGLPPRMEAKGFMAMTVAVNPVDDTVWTCVSGPIGEGRGGVYRSSDRGESWIWDSAGLPLGEKLFKDCEFGGGQSPQIEFHLDGSIAYLRAPMSNSLYRRAGAQWMKCVLPDARRVDVTADPFVPGKVFVGGRPALVTTDGGRTFEKLSGFGPWDSPSAFTCDPHRPGTVVCGVWDALKLSRDGGRTWTRIDEGLKLPTGNSRRTIIDRGRLFYLTTGSGVWVRELSNTP